jgi:4'-phosphopantetheinyl transferase
MAVVSERVQHESGGIRRIPNQIPGDLRLWWVDLDAYAAFDPLVGLEDSDYARADRMAFELDARRLLASRHVLRWLVAEALGRSPRQLVIEADRFGKPRLLDSTVRFSLSRSGRYGLVGVSRELEVGVDVELIRPVPDAEGLAKNHFTAVERVEWQRAGPEHRDRRFLECWTRKEACAKALGTGLLIQPALIEVGCAGDVRVLSIQPGGPPCDVTVCSLNPSVEVVAAVAVATKEAAEVARRASSP